MGNINSFEYQYSVEVEKPTTTGYTGVRRCSTHPDELIDGLTDVDVNSCWQIFKRGCDANPKGNCLGKRAVDGDGNLGGFEWLSFEEVEDKALRVGSALMDLDLVPTVETPDELYKEAQSMKLLGVFAKNRVEWFICEQAANAFGLTLVPLYDTLGDEAVRYILDQTPCVALGLRAEPTEKLWLGAPAGVSEKLASLARLTVCSPFTYDHTSPPAWFLLAGYEVVVGAGSLHPGLGGVVTGRCATSAAFLVPGALVVP